MNQNKNGIALRNVLQDVILIARGEKMSQSKQTQKMRFFEREMTQLDLSEDQKEYLRRCLLDGLEILSNEEITRCIEEIRDLKGWFNSWEN